MTERQFRAGIIAALVGLSAAVYLNTFDGEWVWDDVSSVLLHEHVRDSSKFFELFKEDQHAFGRGSGNFYRPLVAASFMADAAISQDAEQTGMHALDLKPLIFHVSNVVWHAAAAVFLFVLLTLIGAPRGVRAVVPLLFVVHPLHTEAVAYISGRADMMSATFILAALCCAFSAELGKKHPTMRRIASGVLFSLALLSKEAALIYPVLLLLVLCFSAPGEWTWRGRLLALRKGALSLLLAVGITGGYIALRATVLKFAQAAEASNGSSFAQRIVESLQALSFYLTRLFLPVHLHMEQTLAKTSAWTAGLGAVGLLAGLAALLWAIKTRQSVVGLGIAWFIASWLPISGLFPLNAPMAEHWMYLPMMGFWCAFIDLVLRFRTRVHVRGTVLAALLLLGLFFAFLTVERNQDWHSNERLFEATLRENPETLRVNYNLAVAYGDIERNYAGARRHYAHTLDLYAIQKEEQSIGGSTNYLLPEEIEVHLSLAQLSLRQERYAEAVEEFSRIFSALQQRKGELQPQAVAAAMGLGRGLLALGDVRGASQFFQEAAAIEPSLGPQIESLLMGAPIMSGA